MDPPPPALPLPAIAHRAGEAGAASCSTGEVPPEPRPLPTPELGEAPAFPEPASIGTAALPLPPPWPEPTAIAEP